MKYSLIILMIFIISVGIGNGVMPVCDVAVNGKCYGDSRNTSDYGYPKANAGLLFSKNYQNYDSCGKLCDNKIQCFMAAYNTTNHTCSLYSTISYHPSIWSDITLYLWNCCDTNNSYNALNRCPGFWKHKVHFMSDNKYRTLDPLTEFTGINKYQCQMKCLDNPICGAVNFLRTSTNNYNVITCQLIIQFPLEELKFMTSYEWETFQWQCVSNYVPPNPSNTCKIGFGDQRGYWIVQNTSMTPENNIMMLLSFYTMDFHQCLDNCALYPKCIRAWYSHDSFFCALEGDKTATCANASSNIYYKFTTYTWQRCYSWNTEIVKEDPEISDCRTLFDNKFTYIYPIKCGFLPDHFAKPYQCKQIKNPPYGTTFSNYLHCQNNQSFRVIDTEKQPEVNLFNVSAKRVFTGYESFWLFNVSESNFRSVPKSVCDIFDANMDVSNFKQIRIVKRTEWFAPMINKTEVLFPSHPVDNVIISDTQIPLCNCFTFEACSDILRGLQKKIQPRIIQIPYNFVVTGDGLVYECRGWDFIPAAATAEYNHNSLSIALCGNYEHNPNLITLKSVKQLIRLSVNFRKIKENYILYIYNDLRDRPYPYGGLRRVFELWPHYRGHLRVDCATLKVETFVSNIILIAIFFVITLSIIHNFISKLWHTKDCYRVKKCRIEIIYCNLLKKSVEMLPQILMHNFQVLLLENRYVSSFTSPVYWIEDRPILGKQKENVNNCSCRNAIFSIFHLCRLQSQLINVSTLSLLPEINCCSKTIAFVFQRNIELGKEYLLILHLNRSKSLNRFIFRLHQNRCLCDNFNLTEYEFKSLYIEIMDFARKTNTEVRTNNFRHQFQEKYSYVIESKDILRYFSY